MQLAELDAEGRLVIEAYGDGGFRVAGRRVRGNLILFPHRVMAWSVADAAGLSLETLTPILEERSRVDLLMVGCGARAVLPSMELRAALRKAGLGAEFMDTGAACRTYNLLVSEGRRVAAALIAV